MIRPTPAVSYLLPLIRPSAIRGLIVSVIVNAIERKFGRWLTADVEKKILEPISPSLADCYSSPAIVPPVFICGARTALNHSCPGSIFRRHIPPAGFAMFQAANAKFPQFAKEATATHRVSSCQSGCKNGRLSSTFTQTPPRRNPCTTVGCSPEDNQAAETLPNEVGNVRPCDNGGVPVPLPAVVMHSAKGSLYTWAKTTSNRALFSHRATSIAWRRSVVKSRVIT